MRLAGALALAAALCAAPAQAEEAPRCADRNALNGMAVDARLTAIRYYYEGWLRGIADRGRQTCLEAALAKDQGSAILNATHWLVMRDCLAMETAAKMAADAACPP